MADSTISALTAAAVLDGTEVLPIAQATSTVRTTTQAVADLALSAINVVSNTVSQLLSLHNVLSNRVSANSGAAVSVTSAEVQTASAAATSADGHANAASAALSLAVSALQTSIQTASAAATSVDTRVNTVSNLVSQNIVSIAALSNTVSAVSAAVTSVDTRVNTVSNLVSQNIVSIAALSNTVSAVSAAVTSVDTRVNTVSNLVSQHTVSLAALSNLASAISAAVTSVLVYVSAASARTTGAVSVHGLQSIINALSSRISQAAGGGLTSTQVSDMIGSVNGSRYSCRAFSATGSATTSVKGLQSVIDRISNTFSNAFSAGSAMSCRSIDPAGSATASVKGMQSVINQISATLSVLHGQTRILTTTVAASVNGTLTDINGTTVSVVAGGYYEYRAKLQVAMSAANALGIGLTFPGMKDGAAGGIMQGIGSVGASAWQSTIGNVQIMAFDDDGSGSIILSLVKGVISVSPVHIDATFAVSTSGNIVLQYRASLSTSNVKINPGSHVRLFRLA